MPFSSYFTIKNGKQDEESIEINWRADARKFLFLKKK